jgi:hypothetical protein
VCAPIPLATEAALAKPPPTRFGCWLFGLHGSVQPSIDPWSFALPLSARALACSLSRNSSVSMLGTTCTGGHSQGPWGLCGLAPVSCLRCDTPPSRTEHKETPPEFPLTGDKPSSETAQDSSSEALLPGFRQVRRETDPGRRRGDPDRWQQPVELGEETCISCVSLRCTHATGRKRQN